MSAAAIARALRGHRSGDGYLVRCPVAGHGQGNGDRRPSLFIRDGDTRILTRCFAGCDPRDIVAALRDRGLLDRTPTSIGRTVRPVSRPTPPTEPDLTAGRLWRAAGPIEGSVAERYLTIHRGLFEAFPASLRFAPDVFHPRLRRSFPALIAAVQAPDRRLIAVQTLWLSPDGSKALPARPRWNFGPLGDGAVRLGPATDVLGLAEGVEDALAASQLSQLSCWACLGAARMHCVRIPDCVREIHIFADDDDAGQKAAKLTAGIHQDAGRRILVRLPPAGFKDWGDVVRSVGRRRAA